MPRFIFSLIFIMSLSCSSVGQSSQKHNEAVLNEKNEPQQQEGLDLNRVEKMILDQVNEFRKSKNREPVKLNSRLDQASEDFADYMAEKNVFGHDADGSNPSDRAEAHEYESCIVAENIAWASNSAGFTSQQLTERFMSGWKNSPGHRKNMLEPDVIHTGVAVARSAVSGKYYAVQMFGRPRSAMVHFKISNNSTRTLEYRTDDEVFKIMPGYTRTHSSCRAPSLKVPASATQTAGTRPAKEEFTIVRPENGAHYLIVSDKSGALKLTKQ